MPARRGRARCGGARGSRRGGPRAARPARCVEEGRRGVRGRRGRQADGWRSPDDRAPRHPHASNVVHASSRCVSAYDGRMQLRDLEWLVALADHAARHRHGGRASGSASRRSRAPCPASRASSGRACSSGCRPGSGSPRPTASWSSPAAREITAATTVSLAELAPRRDPDAGVVRLAFLDSMATSLVPRLLREFHARAPRVRVVLRQEPAHEILDDLATGAAELAVTSGHPPARTPGCRCRRSGSCSSCLPATGCAESPPGRPRRGRRR